MKHPNQHVWHSKRGKKIPSFEPMTQELKRLGIFIVFFLYTAAGNETNNLRYNKSKCTERSLHNHVAVWTLHKLNSTDKALAPLDEFPRISIQNERNSSSGAKTRNSASPHSSPRSEKEQPAREMTDGISCETQGGNSQNVLFPHNRKEIPMESISNTDSHESILKRRYRV